MALVEARNLKKTYWLSRGLFASPQPLMAVGGISFSLAEGKTLAIVGESGSGKSTLARLITLIEKPTEGSLRLGGIDTADAPENDATRLRRMVQMVFQNPYGSLNPRKTIGSILEQPLIIQGQTPPKDRATRVRDMLAKVGLRPEHAGRYPHMFSGGQRQRIAIARALMLSPKLVVADEPVSALDVSVQAQVLNLLADLQRDLGIAYLFISHDLAVVRYIAHDVLVMYLGLTMEQGDKETIFAHPKHPYTKALLAATPSVEHPEQARVEARGEPPSPLDPPKGCVFSTRCPLVFDRCRVERPALRPVMGRDVACHIAEQV
jgi:dipeptide transport system ATP-binding protein